jgi:heptaprenyl diphosphate synthase
MFSDAPADVVARITVASHALGVAFQLSDDILDVASEAAQSGKAAGTDLREGVRSLPVLHALAPPAAGSPVAGDARLRELLSQDGLTDDSEHAEALALLRGHPAMDAARTDLRRWSDAARTEVAGLPDVPARHAFEVMCDFVVERTS